MAHFKLDLKEKQQETSKQRLKNLLPSLIAPEVFILSKLG